MKAILNYLRSLERNNTTEQFSYVKEGVHFFLQVIGVMFIFGLAFLFIIINL